MATPIPWLLLLVFFTSCGAPLRTTITTMPEDKRVIRTDDSLFVRALDRAIQTTGAIDYVTLRSDSDLTAYLRQLALMNTETFTSRQAELAFWINAHNAYVLDIIRSNLPIRSISDISGFRSLKVALLGGAFYSLDDIEHGILTKKFREPRAFFALFDGARSSPPLSKEPYAESHLSEQLDGQLTRFLGDSTKNYLNKKTNTIYVSERFEEYSDEIESAAGSITAFLGAYAPPPMDSWINAHPNIHIAYLNYDRTLYASHTQTPYEPPTEQPARRSKTQSSGGIR